MWRAKPTAKQCHVLVFAFAHASPSGMPTMVSLIKDAPQFPELYSSAQLVRLGPPCTGTSLQMQLGGAIIR